MPVEESGNMLLMVAALAQVEGNADFAQQVLAAADQVGRVSRRTRASTRRTSSRTDDFAGHLAHNANLSIKAIVALGALREAGDMTGQTAEAATPTATLAAGVRRPSGPQMADDGDHYRLAFDKPGTWSQKYNLVWDKLLGLEPLPAGGRAQGDRLLQDEAEPYGLPLDNRERYTKLDWIVWTATLADSPADFERWSIRSTTS